MAPIPAPVDGHYVWAGPRMADSDEWIVSLDGLQIADLLAAVHDALALGLPLAEITPERYPLQSLQLTVRRILADLTDGPAFVLVRGLPVFDLTVEESEVAYWLLGSHVGIPLPQNAAGEVLVHVRDQGKDYRRPDVRGYQTRAKLDYHVDSSDVVALLCRRPAKAGGASRIVSSAAIHNEMVRQRPDLAAELYSPLAFDRRLPEGAEGPSFYLSPIFSLCEGRLSTRYGRSYIESAQRHDTAPRLTTQQVAALDLLDDIASSPELYLDMIFEAGDMQFLNNYAILHSRTEYEDHDAPDHKRDLVRFWLTLRDYYPLAADFAAGGITPRSAAFR